MTEITSCILSQYLWYSESTQVVKASVHLSIMFCNFLVVLVQLKNGMNLRENTIYMRVLALHGHN